MPPCSSPCSSAFRSLTLLLLKLFVLFGAVLCGAATSKAQDKVELFGGYSYFRASVQEGQISPCTTVCPLPPGFIVTQVTQRANLNGWELSGQYKFLPFLGAVGDFNGTYGKLNGAGTREHTFLVGPQVSLPTKVSPFVHALFGAAKESQDSFGSCPNNTQATCRFSLGSGTSFAAAIGAGFDINLAPLVKVRLIQVDYVRTQLHGATQNQPRASVGFVFHF